MYRMFYSAIILVLILFSALLITSQRNSLQESYYHKILNEASNAGFSLNCAECKETILTDVKGNPYIFYKNMKLDNSLILFELRANPDIESTIGIINERMNASEDKTDFALLSDKSFSYIEGSEYVFQWADGNYNFVVRGEKHSAELFLKSIGVL
jgi:hypothetical protein